MSETPTDRAHPDVLVVGGGRPSPEELAALIVALAPDPPPATEGDAARRSAPWRRAALLEGIGETPPTSPADLRRLPVGG